MIRRWKSKADFWEPREIDDEVKIITGESITSGNLVEGNGKGERIDRDRQRRVTEGMAPYTIAISHDRWSIIGASMGKSFLRRKTTTH